MTNQQIFNKVWDHFIVNENPASVVTREDGTLKCQYRGSNGAKCAVGIFILDEEYDKKMEGLCATDLLAESHSRLSQLTSAMGWFLNRLQSAHDDSALVGRHFHRLMKRDLKELARRYSLKVPRKTCEGVLK